MHYFDLRRSIDLRHLIISSSLQIRKVRFKPTGNYYDSRTNHSYSNPQELASAKIPGSVCRLLILHDIRDGMIFTSVKSQGVKGSSRNSSMRVISRNSENRTTNPGPYGGNHPSMNATRVTFAKTPHILLSPCSGPMSVNKVIRYFDTLDTLVRGAVSRGRHADDQVDNLTNRNQPRYHKPLIISF